MTWDALIQAYGLIVLFVGTALEGEAIVLAAGYLAHEGYFSVLAVMLTAFCGGLFADQGIACLGRRYGPRVLERRPQWRPKVDKARALLLRRGTLLMLGLRFLYGLRTVSLLVIGASGIPAPRFLLLDTIGAVIWAVTYTVAGYFFGHAAETLLGKEKAYQKVILIALFALAGLVWLLHSWRASRTMPGSD